MVNNSESIEAQRLRSPEAAEAHREARPEQLDPVETVESLDQKIVDIDSRIGGYTESVEETSARLTQARAELGMPPLTTEAPNIAQSREAATRLEARKQALMAQREELVADDARKKERPSRLEDHPGYKSLFDDANEHYRVIGADRLKVDGAGLERLIRASAAQSFEQQYPEDAMVYRKAAQAEMNAQRAVAVEQAQVAREAERNKKEAEARARKEVEDAAAKAEQERRENVELGSFDRSIDDFIGGSVISNELGEQLKARRRSGTSDERRAFDEAVSQASYDFRIKGSNPDDLVRALTGLKEGGAGVGQAEGTSNEQLATESVKDKEGEVFKEVLPRGWTNLKHGTNLMNWGEINPYTSDRIRLEKPLSVVSQEEFERDQTSGKRYNTTENYSSATKPDGMSQAEFDKKNKPFEMRVVFLKNHAQDLSDPEYRQGLDKKTLDQIAKYYYANIQGGRHPLVPRGETLVRLGQTQENGQDVFYFVPESIAEAYAKEAGITLPQKTEQAPAPENADVVDRVKTGRNLDNIWANSNMRPSPSLEALKERVLSGTADDVQAIDSALTKAARMYTRTRDTQALADTLLQLSR